MMETVLLKNPKAYKVIEITETHSMIKENHSWSIGTMVSDIYEESGQTTDEKLNSDYLYFFIRDENGKLQMLLFHE